MVVKKSQTLIQACRAIGISVIIMISFSVSMAQDADVEVVTYSDIYVGGSQGVSMPLLPKTQRLSRYASSIKYDNTSLPDDINVCVETALNLWESCIINGATIKVNIEYKPISEDIRTDVLYHKLSNEYVPSALYYYLQNMKPTSVNGTITINSNTDWDCFAGDNMKADGKNLTFGLLRAVARLLGFGSTVKMDTNGDAYFGCKRGYSKFDKMIVDANNKWLSHIRLNGGRPTNDLKSYIDQPDQIFWLSLNNQKWQLYNPPYNLNFAPFSYLSDENSLMRPDIPIGGYMFQIDDVTHSILNAIGWNITKYEPVKIVSDDVPDTGMASAYESHTFRIDKGNNAVSNPEWSCELPLKNGNKEIISLMDNNLSCSLEKIENVDKYIVNINGDIECTLRFTCEIGGQRVEALPFRVFLGLKPVIECVKMTTDGKPSNSFYNANYTVFYRGADYIKVSVEEEYGSILNTEYIYEPNIATGIARQIRAPYYAWIDFGAKNQYGTTTYTVELEPYGVIVDANDSYPSVRVSCDKNQNQNHDQPLIIRVYDVFGHELGVLDSVEDMNHIDYNGIVVLKHFMGDQCVETSKMWVQ